VTRIIGGAGRGRRLATPSGLDTRPSGARVRQTLFDILAPKVRGARFLDAFAGSGGVGFEALSRGAGLVVLVDQSASAVATLRRNEESLARLAGRVEIYRDDAISALRRLAKAEATVDLIYLDPPYASGLYEPLLALVAATSLLAADGSIIAEHFKKTVLPGTMGGLVRTREVRVGDHRLSFYRHPVQGGEE
jgi:16S rRNA (guanine966-N2)-methyltransferase